jgi:hypothetical protein
MHRASFGIASAVAVVAGLTLAGEPGVAAGQKTRAAQADTEVVSLDRHLVRLNTSNPPGNEVQVANYMRNQLAPLGFEVDVIQTPTTRGVSSHSSRPQPPSAIDRLARALARISRHRSRPALSPLTPAFLARARPREPREAGT